MLIIFIILSGCSSQKYIVRTKDGKQYVTTENPQYNKKMQTYKITDENNNTWVINKDEVESIGIADGKAQAQQMKLAQVLPTDPKHKTVIITNKQSKEAVVNISFGSDSAMKSAELADFCTSDGDLKCHFTLAEKSSRQIPNPTFRYLNFSMAANAQVGCGSTKAEITVNSPSWFDHADISLVDGFNEKMQITATSASSPNDKTVLGPVKGKLGNQKVFGVYPYGCDVCAGIKVSNCGNAGTGECKGGTEYVPDVKCQYQMNSTDGTIEIIIPSIIGRTSLFCGLLCRDAGRDSSIWVYDV